MGSLNFSHMICCNGRKFQSSWDNAPDRNWWVYSVSCGPMRFSLRKNQKNFLLKLHLKSLRPIGDTVKETQFYFASVPLTFINKSPFASAR